MSTIQPVFDPFATRPTTTSIKSSFVAPHALIRDQFPISTWLVFGALLQGFAHLFLPYRNIVLVLPVILYLSYSALSTVLILAGILPNPHMKDVIRYRTTPVFPSSSGAQDRPADQPMCAILLGVVSHSPLGMLAPGFKEVGDRFEGMVREMSADATTHGFLGASSWISATDRTSSNEFAQLLYFENEEALHKYAHGPRHSATMRWWREKESELKYVGIMHEVFACPKKSWEGVYLNYYPTGLGATSKEVTGADGRRQWVSPLVRAKGKLAYSKGRMGRAYGDKGWEALGTTLGTEDGM